MQSEYGVPETQQLMMDGRSSSLLSISHDNPDTSQNQRHHIPYHLHNQLQQQQRYLYIPQQMPITLPFFQQHHNSLQAFQQQQQQQRQLHQQLGLDPESAPEPFTVSNFKLGLDENSANRGQVALNDTNDEVLRGRREEDSVIKEPFWKPLDIEYINKNNKRCKEKMETSFEFDKKGEKGTENEEGKSSSNYGLFGELEAIYTISGGIGGNGGNQTGSGSGLTGDNPAATAAAIGLHSGNPRGGGGDHASETSTGEEVPLKKLQKSSKKKKRKQLGVIATFFESLVKQLMEHQDSLHMKFLEVMEKREKERTDREEAWRKQEAAKSERAAIARAQERALASSRDATIVAFLEKIAGESINLPTKTHSQFPSQIQDENLNEESNTFNNNKLTNGNNNNNKVTSNADNNNYIVDGMNINIARRWPKAEVQALIRVRSGLECKFQEPGLKGPLWELVSSSMASMGYERSAKRCKEKWENINKYFRKTKDSAKKRSQQSKTCPYFHQLDQLYSKSFNTPEKPSHSVTTAGTEAKGNSELLGAIVIPTDNDDSLNPPLKFSQEQINMSRGFNFSEMGPLGLDFNGNGSDNPDEGDGNGEEDEEEEDDDVDGEDQDENQDHVKDLGY